MYQQHFSSVHIVNGGPPAIQYVNDHVELDVSKWEVKGRNRHIAVQITHPPFTLAGTPEKTRTLLLSNFLCLSSESSSHDLQPTTVYLREPQFRASLSELNKLPEILEDYDVIDRNNWSVYYSENFQSPFGDVWQDKTKDVHIQVNWRTGAVNFKVSQFGCYCVILASEVLQSQTLPYLNTISKTANESTYRLMTYKKPGDEFQRYIFDMVPVIQNPTNFLFKAGFQQVLFSTVVGSQNSCLYGIVGDCYELRDEQVLEFYLNQPMNMQAGTLVEVARSEDHKPLLEIFYQSGKMEPMYWFSMRLFLDGHVSRLIRSPVIYKDFLPNTARQQAKAVPSTSTSIDINKNTIQMQMQKEIATAESWSQSSEPINSPETNVCSTNSDYVPFSEFKVGSVGKASWNALMKLLDSRNNGRSRKSSVWADMLH